MTAAQLSEASAAATSELASAGVPQPALETIDEGLCVQTMQWGPYRLIYKTVGAMRRYMESNGVRTCGLQHEIYLDDLRFVRPDVMTIVVRQPVVAIEEHHASCDEIWE